MRHLTYRGKQRLAHLEDIKASLKTELARCEQLIANVKRIAVLDGVAMWSPGTPRELAPTKAWWLEHEGIDRWNAVKGQSKASDVFTWLIS